MQQTQTYKLNLIESSDPFSPDALNANTQKVEDVLARREAVSDEKLAEMDGRVTVLEGHKFTWGSYHGNGGSSQTVQIGFTPVAVLVVGTRGGSINLGMSVAAENGSYYQMDLVEGGFRLNRAGPLTGTDDFAYIAFG